VKASGPYLYPIDRAVTDSDIDYIRFVDDIRMFCGDIPGGKKALMFLTQSLRQADLTCNRLQTPSRLEAVAQHTDEKDGNRNHQLGSCSDSVTAATPQMEFSEATACV
jgi:hypothetical protein